MKLRIAIFGDEEISANHIKQAKSIAASWNTLANKRGLKISQSSFVTNDGVKIFLQKNNDIVSLRIESARHQEETYVVKNKKEEFPQFKRVFYVKISNDYFWIIIERDEDKNLSVSLMPFVAEIEIDIMTTEFLYPAMNIQSSCMISGSIENFRYVISQKSGVVTYDDTFYGRIEAPSIISNGKIHKHDENHFVIISGNSFERYIYVIKTAITDGLIGASIKYGSVNVDTDAESGKLAVNDLCINPCWIHRKCFGSYFNPQKTIGFHVDIGTDDARMGNTNALGSSLQDKLVPEFNASRELYMFGDTLNIYDNYSDDSVTLFVITPTIVFDTSTPDIDKCWGGYAWGYGAGCADYQGDFNRWMLAPRIIKATLTLSSGAVDYKDILTHGIKNSSVKERVAIKALASNTNAYLIIDNKYRCGNTRIFKAEEEVVNKCQYDTEATGRCNIEDPNTYTYTAPAEFDAKRNLTDYAREDLQLRRLNYLIFGDNSEDSNTPKLHGYYHLFEGLFHLDIGVMWSRMSNIGNSCGLCSLPTGVQVPGGLIFFFLLGYSQESAEWISANGHEYVKNLQIVTPLGVHPHPTGGSAFGFWAKVPEAFAAPHDPEVLVGGIEYQSEDIGGALVQCERPLMSAPCICDGGFSFDMSQYGCGSFLSMTGGRACIQGGCAPFNWSITGGSLIGFDGTDYGSSETNTQITSFLIKIHDHVCSAKLTITDVCGETIELEAENPGGARPVFGPNYLWQDATAVYYHGMGSSAVYTGGLILESHDDNSAILRMPSSQEDPVEISWAGDCGWTASMTVTPGFCDCQAVGAIAWACYPTWCSWLTPTYGELGIVGGCGPFTWHVTGGVFIDGTGASLGSSLVNTPTRYVRVSAPASNCEMSVSCTDTDCGTSISKDAEVSTQGVISGPTSLQWEQVATYYHNMGASAVYSGELVLVSQTGSSVVLKMPDGQTSVADFTISGQCGMSDSYSVTPLYCGCNNGSFQFASGYDSVSVSEARQIIVNGGCPPFYWKVDGGSLSGGVNNVTTDSKSFYVYPDGDCYTRVFVIDNCGHTLSDSDSINNSVVITGPTSLGDGETGTYYHNIIGAALYSGGLTLISQAGNALILKMPEGSTGTKTVTVTGPCGQMASMSVVPLVACANVFVCDGVSYCVGPMLSMTPDCIRIDKIPERCGYDTSIVTPSCIVSGSVFERRVFTYERSPWTCYSWFTYNCEFYPIIAVQ